MDKTLKSIGKSCENLSFWRQGKLNISQNDAQEHSGGELGSRPRRGPARETEFNAILAPLKRFWMPFGTPLGAEALAKSTISAP